MSAKTLPQTLPLNVFEILVATVQSSTGLTFDEATKVLNGKGVHGAPLDPLPEVNPVP